MKQLLIRVREYTYFIHGYRYLIYEYYDRKFSTFQEMQARLVTRVNSTTQLAEIISISYNRWNRFRVSMSATLPSFIVLVQQL
jgi:hypothetical protein